MTVAYSVNGSAGLITITGDDVGAQELASIDERYVDITVGMDWTLSGTGGTFTIENRYRIDSGAYYGVEYVVDLSTDTVTSITLTDTGTPLETVVVSIAHTPGTPVSTRIKSTDRQQIRAWVGAEPSTWDIDIVEDSLPSGSVSLGAVADIAGTAPAAVTVTWMAGFELGYIPTVNGAPVVNQYYTTDSNLTNTGPGGGRDGVGCAAIVDVVAGNGGFTLNPGNYTASRTRMTLVFYINYTTLPSGNSEVLRILPDTSSTHILSYRSSDSRLIFETSIGPVITNNTWYRIDISASTQGSTNITVDWQIDGVAQTQFVEATGGTSPNFTTLSFGPVNGGATTLRLLMDDFVIEFGAATPLTSYPFGETRVVLVGPDVSTPITEGAQANSNCRFTSNGGGLDATFNSANILAAISEFPIVFGGSASGMYSRLTGVADARATISMDTYTLQDGESIAGVLWVIASWQNQDGSSFDNANIFARGLINALLPADVYNSNSFFSHNISTPPIMARMYTPTGGWDQAKLDDLQFDWCSPSDNTAFPGFHYMGVELALRSADGTIEVEFDDLEILACVNEA